MMISLKKHSKQNVTQTSFVAVHKYGAKDNPDNI